MALKPLVPIERNEFAALVVVTLGFVFLFMSSSHFPWRDPATPDRVIVLKPELSDTSPTLKLVHVVGDAWNAESRGASIGIDVPDGPWISGTIRLTGSVEDTWTAALVFRSSAAVNRQMQPHIVPGRTHPLEIPPLLQGLGTLSLELSPNGAGAELRRAEIVFSAREPGAQPPCVPGHLFGALLPAALGLWLHFTSGRALRRTLVVGTISGFVFFGLTLYQPGTAQVLLGITAGMLMAAGSAAAWRTFKERTSDYRAAEVLIVLGAMGLALLVRWQSFVDVYTRPLLPDAAGYLKIVTMAFPLPSDVPQLPIREPLFPLIIRLFGTLAEPTGVGMRVLGVLLGALPVGAAWLLLRRPVGRIAALVVAFAIAVNPHMAALSAEGLRDDLLSALFMGLLAAVVYTGRCKWWRVAAFVVLAAALTLTRLNFLFFCPLVLAFAVWKQRWSPPEAITALALFLLAVAPHLYSNANHMGDPIYTATYHTAYYYNYAHIGEPGFPATVAEWAAAPYAGGRVPTMALLTEHPITRIARGYWRLFVIYPHGYLFGGREWLMLFGFVGLFALRKSRGLWLVLAAYLVASFPLALAMGMKFEPRLSTINAPIILAVWAAGIVFVGERLITRVRLYRTSR